MTDAGNRSGGADFNANEVDVGGDVVGRDKVVQQTTTHNYYGALPSQPRRAELPHQPYFFGREDELAIISEALDPESNGWGVLIDGPGGIGKTALAIRAGHLAPDNVYPTKIFLSAKVRELTPQGEQKLEDFMLPNYMALLAELARELGDEGIERIDPSERPKEVRRLLENSYALIIIDNLETFDEKERERLFQFLKRLPHSCKAIVTSRRRTDVVAEIIRLDRLSAEATQKLITKLAERNKYLARATDKEREDLYEITKGNPLLIEWVVGQLGRSKSKCRTIADACRYLETAPKDNDPLEYIFGDLLDTFTEHEIATLATLTYFTLPARVEWIAEISGIPRAQAETALEDLSDRALIVGDVQMQTYMLPPLAATFLRHNRPGIVAKIGNRLADKMYALLLENGYRNYERFSILEDQWSAIAASLPLLLQGYNDRLKPTCDALEFFLEFSARWDERLSIDMTAEQLAANARDFFTAGWRAYKSGWIYFLRGQEIELLNCTERVERYWTDASDNRQGYMLRLRALGYMLKGDYSSAIDTYQRALQLWRAAAGRELTNQMSLGHFGLAQAEHLAGDLAAAEQDYLEALRIATYVSPSDAIASITGSLAELASDRGDWSKAESLAREALQLSENVGRRELIARDCSVLAKALAKLNRCVDGLPYAQRAVEIFTRLRHRDLANAQAILKECGG